MLFIEAHLCVISTREIIYGAYHVYSIFDNNSYKSHLSSHDSRQSYVLISR